MFLKLYPSRFFFTKVSLLTTDDLYGQVPPLEKDLYFGESPPDYLPYTKSSIKGMSKPHIGSMAELQYVPLLNSDPLASIHRLPLLNSFCSVENFFGIRLGS